MDDWKGLLALARSIAKRLGYRGVSADDLAQDAMLALLVIRTREPEASRENLSARLFGIIRHINFNRYRGKKRRNRREVEWLLAARADLSRDLFSVSDEALDAAFAILDVAIEKLNGETKTVMKLWRKLGKKGDRSYANMGRVLGMSANKVKRLVLKALLDLGDDLED